MLSEKPGSIPDALAVDLEKIVEYAPHSIVSREIVKNKSGTLTVFAFDAGQGLSEHTAPFDAVVQVLDGEAEVIIDKKKLNVKKGETVIMPANVPHAVNAMERFKMQLVMIKG
ncbi:MAG TPA: cupin domain-containing protein [bacterium]|nr:cupin domain-containing protein [bacterium]